MTFGGVLAHFNSSTLKVQYDTDTQKVIVSDLHNCYINGHYNITFSGITICPDFLEGGIMCDFFGGSCCWDGENPNISFECTFDFGCLLAQHWNCFYSGTVGNFTVNVITIINNVGEITFCNILLRSSELCWGRYPAFFKGEGASVQTSLYIEGVCSATTDYTKDCASTYLLWNAGYGGTCTYSWISS